MFNHFSDFSLFSGPDFPPHTLKEIDAKSPKGKSPALISNAMLPEDVTIEGGEWLSSVTYETPNSVCIKGKDEDKSKMVGIPKCLKALLANLVMGCGVHKKHTEKHDMTSDATSLGVVNLDGGGRSNL